MSDETALEPADAPLTLNELGPGELANETHIDPEEKTASDLAPLLAQQTALQQQLDNQMVSTAIQIRGVLTPDQLAKVAEVHEKLKQIRTQIDSILGPPDAPPLP